MYSALMHKVRISPVSLPHFCLASGDVCKVDSLCDEWCIRNNQPKVLKSISLPPSLPLVV